MGTGGMAWTARPPYYAAILTSTRTAADRGHAETSERMAERAYSWPEPTP